ncbi:MAG TPA: sugar phosphate isomerase/epimerase, partial [Geodermatophilus sp.]|nr:sugar phosphate isomerase/epimerase [Geodermatophilus sp.]
GAAGLDLLVEAPHSRRLCADLDRSEMLYEALGDAPVGAVLDLSHVVAGGGDEVDAVRRFGDRIRHVHLRDAVPGDINRSIGRGEVDFAAAIHALTAAGYQGHYSLELETHDISDADRPAEAGRAGRYISSLLRA